MQATYDEQRAAYEEAYAQITAWQSDHIDPARPSSRQSLAGSLAGSLPDGLSGDESRLDATLRTPPALAQAGCKSRRNTRKSITSRAPDASVPAATCPVHLPPVPEPVPPLRATQHLREALAAAAAAPWATPAARFEVAACVMALPTERYTPAPRPPLDTPPPTPPPAPLPLNGYLWSALGKTTFIVDGIDMSKEKLEELEQRIAAREAAAAAAPALAAA